MDAPGDGEGDGELSLLTQGEARAERRESVCIHKVLLETATPTALHAHATYTISSQKRESHVMLLPSLWTAEQTLCAHWQLDPPRGAERVSLRKRMTISATGGG